MDYLGGRLVEQDVLVLGVAHVSQDVLCPGYELFGLVLLKKIGFLHQLDHGLEIGHARLKVFRQKSRSCIFVLKTLCKVVVSRRYLSKPRVDCAQSTKNKNSCTVRTCTPVTKS